MKREFNIIRYMLERIEGSKDVKHYGIKFKGDKKGCTEGQLMYHAQLLIDEGYIKGEITATPETYIKDKDSEYYLNVRQITWRGHDLLDKLRGEKVFEVN